MSRSPERISSYRRHFEGGMGASSSIQVRVSSPSPTRREVRHRSASYSRSGGSMSRRLAPVKSRMTSSVSMGALCFGMSMGLGPRLDLDAAAAENQDFLSTRTNERQEMVALNDRLATYIEKVRTLEQENKLLEAEISILNNRFVKPSGLRQLYEGQLRELTRLADQTRVQRDLALAAKQAMAGQLEVLKVKYEDALEARKKVELDIEAFRPDVDKATSARIALEKQLEQLEVELEFLQRVHKEEVEELMAQIFSIVARVDVSFALPDLSSALKHIQSQYDSIAAKNLQEMDSWYKSKFQDMTNASTKHAQGLRSVREEMAGYKRDILNKERELDTLKIRNEYLEIQIREALEKFKKEEEALQERAEELKVELKVTKEKIALLLREYQDLLNVKMSLEIEITTYRKLIEGEDFRLGHMFQGMSLTGGAGGGGAMSIGASDGDSAAVSSPPVAAPPAEEQEEVEAGPSEPAVHAIGVFEEKSDPEEKPPIETITSDSQTPASWLVEDEQPTETTERKTLLIRTVKTEDDTFESDEQERTFTISGAADEDEE